MMTMSPIISLEYYDGMVGELPDEESLDDDYFQGKNKGEPQGIYAGKAAPLLKLKGKVQSKDYYNIMRGFDPQGKALCQQAGDKHRAGFDLCFSAEKSVSVVWARADMTLKRLIEKAHHQAVLAAIDHLEEHAAITRRGHNGTEREQGLGLLFMVYEHSTSRSLDPQLHSHALCANLLPRSDGTWGTIESRDLFLHQCSAASFYRAELAVQLQQLGFSLESHKDTFRIKGVPQSLCQHFSKRGQDIKRALNKAGIRSSKSKAGDIISLDTREKKQQVDRPELTKRWQAEMDEQGFTIESLEALQQPHAVFDPMAPILDEESILAHVSERSAVFRKQDIYRAGADIAQHCGESAKSVNTIIDALFAEQEVVSLGVDYKHNQLFTTKTILNAEKQLIEDAKILRSREDYLLDVETIEHVIEKAKKQGFQLSDEQLEAVLDVCSPNAFAILQGSAGSGKTRSLDIVRQVAEKQGFKLIGAVIGKLGAENLAKEANIPTSTVTRLLIDIENGKSPLTNKTILVIDEAGQLGSADLSALLKAAKEAGSKVVLTGEDKQLDSVNLGGSLRYLSRPEIIGTSRIETVRRQRKPWARECVMQLRDGQVLASLKTHDEQGLVHFSKDSAAARLELVKQWDLYQKSHPDKQAVVLAQSWKDVKSLCDELRVIHQTQGTVGHENIKLECVVSDKPMWFNFSVGERIRFTKNDYRRGFSNGKLGRITALEKQANGHVKFTVQTDNYQLVTFSTQDYCDEHGRLYLAQAYALTVYASQGITVDGSTFLLHNTGMDRATSYVAGSRHKDNCHWFFNQSSIQERCNNGGKLEREQALEAVATLMSQDRYKALAIEYLPEQAALEQTLEKTLTQEESTLEPELELDW
ncbi:MAG: conjugative relaxase-like TrwC/TraI family protein [Alteromonadaceae bacterium]|jgi:conjugative relaxase-like TrwC/TraI family protein